MVEKIIHSIEFQNPYTNSVEEKPEIIDIVETNYKIARRVYQDLDLDIADLFQKFIRSFTLQDMQDMNDDIKSNEWGARNILDIEHSLELLNIFQTFYHTTGRLPLSNGLLIVPDGDAPGGKNKLNMKSLFDMSKHTYSRGLVSLPFLGVIHYYFDATDQQLIKNAQTELYGNLSYITLSGARDFEFANISNLTARISFLIKSASRQNIKNREREDRENTYRINNDVSFIPKSSDPLDVVLDILDENIEHKKTTHPYVPPQVQTAPTIEIETQVIDNEFANLKEQYDRVGNVAAEQKEQKETEELVDSIIKDKNPFQNVEINDIWIDDDLFDNNDLQAIVETSKQIIDEITPNPLIVLNIATTPDTEDEMDDDDIDFTIADLQLVEGNDTQVNRDTEGFVDFTVTNSRVVDSDSDNNIDFTVTDSQLVKGNDTSVSRENEPFVDFTITDSSVVRNSNNGNNSEIDFAITSSELVEGNDPTVNRETEPFIDFTITDSRAIDSEDGIETIKVTMDDDICIPNTNMIGRDTGLPKGKK